MNKDTFASIIRGAKQALDYAKGSRSDFVQHRVETPQKVNLSVLLDPGNSKLRDELLLRS